MAPVTSAKRRDDDEIEIKIAIEIVISESSAIRISHLRIRCRNPRQSGHIDKGPIASIGPEDIGTRLTTLRRAQRGDKDIQIPIVVIIPDGNTRALMHAINAPRSAHINEVSCAVVDTEPIDRCRTTEHKQILIAIIVKVAHRSATSHELHVRPVGYGCMRCTEPSCQCLV